MATHVHQTVSAPAGEAEDASSRRIVVVAAPGRQTLGWVIAVLLAVIAAALVMRLDDAALLRSSLAQSTPTGGGLAAGARSVYAFTGQLDGKTYGLFMMDVDSGTIWCYEIAKGQAGMGSHLKLVAARSWIFDRYLEEFNVAAPTPAEVRQLVEQQQTNRPGAAGPGNQKPPANP
ncbi:MAG TPA: hypothetical protein PKY77_20380 [Phycisphaerae bacterium]|nr:hypothetical protein [Phycisphaerae bacterium]HRY68595.1 hypothetical protein [Phycisphaerae bacterium]HSA25644.1 hypothetical protein [Phycisphaerae bacterium]